MLAGPILAAMVAHRHAWISAAELRASGCDPAGLEALEADGLVVRWTLPGGDQWCLTPLAAERIGVVMDERWERQGDGTWLESPRWVEPERASDSVRLPGRHGSYRLAELAEDLRPPEPVRAARQRGPVPAIDPVSGLPLKLFGGRVAVYLDLKARPKRTPNPARPARRGPPKKRRPVNTPIDTRPASP